MLVGVAVEVTIAPELALSQDVSAQDLGVKSDARAFLGEQGEVMLIGEAGFGGEGFARGVVSFSSVGGGDLDGPRCFFSL